MCGIGGYVAPRGTFDGERFLSVVGGALAHRGPDGEGVFRAGPFGLIHRRLAIIDLSEGGAQPMTVGPITVAFNGEIYNYKELREELRNAGSRIIGASDTEVLAQAYLHWGEQCVQRFRGMWAFAIFDSRSRTLFCARDPFGIKPLYYAWYDGAFVFASEPQALVRAGVKARANLRIAAHYLALGISEHEPQSFFEGITPVAAGASMVVSEDAVPRVIDVMDGCMVRGSGAASFEDFSQSLRESVKLHLRSDVPVGTCLSGGLDSSTVAALASGAVRASGGPKFAAVTAISGEAATNEREYAAAVVKQWDLAWHTVEPSAGQFVFEADDSIRAQGEPALSPSMYFQYCVMRGAKAAGLKVMLDGQGADELLCGYERYAPTWALEVARRAGICAALGGFARVARNSRPGMRGMAALAGYVLVPSLRRRVISERIGFMRPAFRDRVMELVAHITSTGRDLHATRVADIREFSLPALLRFEDRNSMAHSIEARVPYVDREVVSCALRLPDAQLLRDGYTKYPLRLLAASMLPHSIAWRRAKVGFEPNSRLWLSALRKHMQQEVQASSIVARLSHTIPRVDRQPLPLQWRLYNLARWQRLFAVDAV